MAWSIVKGPRKFDSLPGRDMDGGWAYDLERDGGSRTVSVVVAGGRLNAGDLPEESKRAISTTGRSAVDAILDREELPRYIVVTSSGLRGEEGQTLPLFEFWHSSTDSISWYYQDDPKLGDQIVLGDDVFRVIAGRPLSDCAAYDVEFVRRATFEESQAAGIGLDDLRLSGDW